MSEGMIPKIRFKGFEGKSKELQLADFGKAEGGTAIESEFSDEGTYKVISIGSYSENSKYNDQGIRALLTPKTKRRILNKDDLTMILNDKTSSGKIIGRVLLIEENSRYVYNQRTERIQLYKDKVLPIFAYHMLNADVNRNKIVRSAQGNTQIYVNWTDISKFYYNLPSLPEQSAIGAFFSTLDDLLSAYKDNLANYQSFKSAMLSKMFPKHGQKVPEIRLAGFEGEWEDIKLSDFGKAEGGTAIESEFSDEGTHKVISIGSYSENSKYNDQGIRALLTPKTKRRVLNKDDLTMILNDKTSSGRIIGRVLLIDESNRYVYNQRTERIQLYKDKILPKFAYHMLNADVNRNKIVRSAQGNTQIYVNWTDISNFYYSMPHLPEQHAIGAFFANLDDLIASYQAKIENLETLKKKLLQEMFV